MEDQPTQELVVAQSNSIVMPAVESGAAAVEAWNKYEDVKAKILDKEKDIQVISGNEFKKKSYWKKLGTFFNLDVSIIEERKEQGATDDPMDFVYHLTTRAQAANGRFVDAVGSCASYEKAEWDAENKQWVVQEKKWNGKYMSPTGKTSPAQPNTEHNVRATAYTRASNRAVSDLVGGGEVSAEEVNERTAEQYHDPAPKPTKKAEPIEADDVFAVAAESKRSDEEIATMYDWGTQAGHTQEKVNAMIFASFKVKDPGQLDDAQYEKVVAGFKRQAEAK